MYEFFCSVLFLFAAITVFVLVKAMYKTVVRRLGKDIAQELILELKITPNGLESRVRNKTPNDPITPEDYDPVSGLFPYQPR